MASNEVVAELMEKSARFQKVIDGFTGINFTISYVSTGYNEDTGKVSLAMPLELQKSYSNCKDALAGFYAAIEVICTNPSFWEALALKQKKIETSLATGFEMPEEAAYNAYDEVQKGKTIAIASYEALGLGGKVRSEVVLLACADYIVTPSTEEIDSSQLN